VHLSKRTSKAGFEEGVFVDGAFMDVREVIDLAELPRQKRERRLDGPAERIIPDRLPDSPGPKRG
jgi:hypothetical protein